MSGLFPKRRCARFAGFAAVVVLLAVACPGGCAAVLGSGWGTGRIEDRPVYPEELEQADVLDIHVFRRATTLRLTNTTARSFGPGRIWLNKWYSRGIDGLAVGETIEIPLRRFRDRYGEPFRAGGFFATEDPERLVLAQLEVDDRLLGLVVVRGSGD